MKQVLIPLLLMLFLSCTRKEEYTPFSEAELKEMLLKDANYINYAKAKQEFVEGIMYNKWSHRKGRKVTKQELLQTKTPDERKELFRKAGYDEGFTDAFNKMYFSQAKVKRKYKLIIQKQPKLFEKVVNANSKPPKPDVEKIKAIYSKQYNH